MDHVDGFERAVPLAQKEAYVRYASEATRIFRDHGATRVVEVRRARCTGGFVLSWPIVPELTMDRLPYAPVNQRPLAAMMGMRKPNIAASERAHSQP